MTIPPFDSVRNFGAEEVTEQDLLMEKNTGIANRSDSQKTSGQSVVLQLIKQEVRTVDLMLH